VKAVVCTRDGPPRALQLRELPKPSPKDDEVWIRVHATVETSSDCIVRSFNLPLPRSGDEIASFVLRGLLADTSRLPAIWARDTAASL
jgi:NADPH:quinone reductase-like Zn-dependent oxidoreductase